MTAGNFGSCLPYTLREEGGFSDDLRDPGGRTMRGVTQRTYDKYRTHEGLPRQDVKLIPDAELKDLYRNEIWDAARCEDMPSGIDLSVFDLAVNSGVAEARKIFERARAGDAAPNVIIKSIADERLAFLHGLSTWRAFGPGWAARVARIEAASLAMARLPVQSGAYAAAKKSEHAKDAAGAVASIGVAAGAVMAPMIHFGFPWWGMILFLIPIAVAIAIALRAAELNSQRAMTLEASVSDMLAARKAAKDAQQAVAAALAAEEAKVSAAKAAITAGSPQPSAPTSGHAPVLVTTPVK